jgi:hypothetical protein
MSERIVSVSIVSYNTQEFPHSGIDKRIRPAATTRYSQRTIAWFWDRIEPCYGMQVILPLASTKGSSPAAAPSQPIWAVVLIGQIGKN